MKEARSQSSHSIRMTFWKNNSTDTKHQGLPGVGLEVVDYERDAEEKFRVTRIILYGTGMVVALTMYLSQCIECISHTVNLSVSNEGIRDPQDEMQTLANDSNYSINVPHDCTKESRRGKKS